MLLGSLLAGRSEHLTEKVVLMPEVLAGEVRLPTVLEALAAPDLLTVPQAAPLVDLHPDTLYRLCRTGQFPPAVKIGAHWRVSVPRLQRYLHGEAS